MVLLPKNDLLVIQSLTSGCCEAWGKISTKSAKAFPRSTWSGWILPCSRMPSHDKEYEVIAFSDIIFVQIITTNMTNYRIGFLRQGTGARVMVVRHTARDIYSWTIGLSLKDQII